ncbi:hypothetical protein CERZMDRAFT_81636 [Cercospora zeae-maydis SCOH1-5]|uniref:Uncharacterized protein n=1 Tax=Cercospora zeae-maydis SCOH1-5 TaxID=717836 RepID=A0A6A6FSW9_9PEZI|nr:hypothetical protein CERZMDRAFT_81636 [Cercospora zeae-maydis SCOH1-5]
MPHERNFSHRRGPHGRHHNHNFPPQRYCDLSHHDMTLLAPLFRPIPCPSDPSYSTHASTLRSKILDLPAHLRRAKPGLPTSSSSFAAKFSYSSSSSSSSSEDDSTKFCDLHHNLSPRPIESLLRHLRSVVRLENLKMYDLEDLRLELLGDMVVIFGGEGRSRGRDGLATLNVKYGEVSAAFVWDEDEDDEGEEDGFGLRKIINKVGRKGKEEKEKKKKTCCAACKISNVAGDSEGLKILGAFVIGAVGKRFWKCSKRVRWMELWVAAVEGRDDVEMRDVVKPMWELAVEFARLRRDFAADDAADDDSGQDEDERDWIEEFQHEIDQNKKKMRRERRGRQDVRDYRDEMPSPSPSADEPGEDDRRSEAGAWYMPSPPETPRGPRRRAPDAMSNASSVYSQYSAMRNWDGFRESQEPLIPTGPPRPPPRRYPTPTSISSGVRQSSAHEPNSRRRLSASTVSQIIDLYRR